MSKALTKISTLLIILVLATITFAYDVGNCNSCPNDCDVTYMGIGGDVLVSYTCLSFYWGSGSCAPKSDDAKCSDYLYNMPECRSKRGVAADSKCDASERPAPTPCSTKVGCGIGGGCKKDTCVALELGECEKDDDCYLFETKPYCSRKGKCDENSATMTSSLLAIALVVIGSIAF